MSRTHLRKIVRDIVARRTRTILVSIGIFVGVLSIVALTTMGQLITNQLEKDLVPSEMAMMRIYLTLPRYLRVDNEAMLQLLKRQSAVTAVEGQAAYQLEWRTPDDEVLRPGQLYAYTSPLAAVQLEPPRLLRGRYPRADAMEITIDTRMADLHGLAIGDTLIARSTAGHEQELAIVGIVFQPYIYFGSDQGEASIYTELDVARQIVDFSGLSSLYVRFSDFPSAREQGYRLRELIREQTPYNVAFYLWNDPHNNAFTVGVHQFTNVLVIISILAMVVASFLVTNVINTIISEQRAQIGAMKALGANQWDIHVMYLGIALGYGLLGTIPGIALGVPFGRWAALAAAPLANTVLQDTSPPPSAIALGAIMGLLVPVVGALIPVFNGSRVTIRDAMSDRGIEARFGRGPLAWLMSRLPVNISVSMAINSLLRHKTRLLLTGLALTLAAGAFMGVFAVFQRLTVVATEVRDKAGVEIDLSPGDIEIRGLVQSLLTDTEIREIAPGVAVRLVVGPTYAPAPGPIAPTLTPSPGTPSTPAPTGVPLRGDVPPEGAGEATAAQVDAPEPLFVTAVDPAVDPPNLELTAGTGWQNDPDRAGIVLSSAVAARFDKAVGDMIMLSSPENTAEFEVIGIADFPLDLGFMDVDQLKAFVGPLRDAPTPNAYWELVDVADGDRALADDPTVWAVGIDQRVGSFFVPGFTAETEGVIISQALAERIERQEGDMITLYVSEQSLIDELLDERSRTYPILRVAEVPASQLEAVIEDPPPGLLDDPRPAIVALHWSELASLAGLDYRAITPETFYVDLSNGDDVPRPKAVYENQLQFTDRVVQTILSLGLVMNMASLLMAVVGGIGLLTIMSINVFERQREIGVMRSVGATTRAVMIQFMLEGVFFGVTTWLIGIPLSYFISKVLLASVPFSEVIGYDYTWVTPAVGLVSMMVLTGLATLYPSIKAGQKTVSDILRYQ